MKRSLSIHRLRGVASMAMLAVLSACGGEAPQAAADAGKAPPSRLALIPEPASTTTAEGSFVLAAGTPVHGDGEQALVVARQFATLLAQGQGPQLEASAGTGAATGAVSFRLDPARASSGREAYLLEVGTDGVVVSAGDPAGLF